VSASAAASSVVAVIHSASRSHSSACRQHARAISSSVGAPGPVSKRRSSHIQFSMASINSERLPGGDSRPRSEVKRVSERLTMARTRSSGFGGVPSGAGSS